MGYPGVGSLVLSELKYNCENNSLQQQNKVFCFIFLRKSFVVIKLRFYWSFSRSAKSWWRPVA